MGLYNNDKSIILNDYKFELAMLKRNEG